MDKLLQEAVRAAGTMPSATQGMDHWYSDLGVLTVLVENWTGSYWVTLEAVQGVMCVTRVEQVDTEREVPRGARWDYAARAAMQYMGWDMGAAA